MNINQYFYYDLTSNANSDFITAKQSPTHWAAKCCGLFIYFFNF